MQLFFEIFQHRTGDCTEHHVDGIILFFEALGDPRDTCSRKRAGLDLPAKRKELTSVGADVLNRRLPRRGKQVTKVVRFLDSVTPPALRHIDLLPLVGQLRVDGPFPWPSWRAHLDDQFLKSLQSIEVDGAGIVEGKETGRTLWFEVGECQSLPRVPGQSENAVSIQHKAAPVGLILYR